MTEHDEQVALFEWAAYWNKTWPELKLLFAIPNGGHRHKAVAARMRAEGVKAGVPDIFLPVPRGEYHGLFIEMKFGRNKTTAKQCDWIEQLTAQGYACIVCNGFESARAEIVEYLEQGEKNG